MNQSRFLTIFIGAHIFFILLQIHKHTQIVRHTYKKQELEQLLALAHTEKEVLTQQLCQQKNHEEIHKYAQHKLGMKPLNISAIKTIRPS